MKKILSISLLALITVVSCKKKDSSQPSSTSGSTTGTTATAASKCSITHKTVTYPGQASSNTQEDYIYSSDGLLTQEKDYDANNNPSGRTDYVYNAGKLQSATTYDRSGNPVYYAAFDWNSSGQISKQSVYGYSQGQKVLSDEDAYTYTNGKLTRTDLTVYSGTTVYSKAYSITEYDNAGNAVKETFYDGSNNVTSTLTRTYDSKPYRNSAEPAVINTSVNNVLTFVNKGANGNVVNSAQFTYDYNSDNYVTRATTNASGNGMISSVTDYQYTCK